MLQHSADVHTDHVYLCRCGHSRVAAGKSSWRTTDKIKSSTIQLKILLIDFSLWVNDTNVASWFIQLPPEIDDEEQQKFSLRSKWT